MSEPVRPGLDQAVLWSANRLRQTPLRIKLVAAILALVTAALGVISLVGTIALRSYLNAELDQQLAGATAATENYLHQRFTDYDQARGFELPSDFVIQITSSDGRDVSLHIGDRTKVQSPPFPQGDEAVQVSALNAYSAMAPDGKTHWRVLVTPLGENLGVPETSVFRYPVLMVAVDMRNSDRAVRRLIWIDLLVGGGVLLILAAVGAGIVRSSLRPLRQIEQTAAAIAAGDLSQRVPDPEPGADPPVTELGGLSRALNTMLVQVESAFTAQADSESRAVLSEEKMRRFVADASHELRTPLTTIRGFAELHRQGLGADPAESARLVRRIEDEAARMGLLVEDLLLLARLDQQRPLERAPVELAVLASDAVHAAQATAPDRAIGLEFASGGAELVALGDDARLRQVFGNLMTNALTHTPAEAEITLRLGRESPAMGVIDVIDTGPGIPPDKADRVFERFFRADPARSRHTGVVTGTGLGLAIVAAIVGAHGGTVQVFSAPQQGTTFRVRLPLIGTEAD